MAGAKGRRWKCKSRPCSECGRWFTPDPRVGARQKTCGRRSCQLRRHRRVEQESRRVQVAEERQARLRERLCAEQDAPGGEAAGPLAPLRRDVVVEVFGADGAVILEELARSFK